MKGITLLIWFDGNSAQLSSKETSELLFVDSTDPQPANRPWVVYDIHYKKLHVRPMDSTKLASTERVIGALASRLLFQSG